MQKEPLALRVSERIRAWLPLGAATIGFIWTVSNGGNGNHGLGAAFLWFIVGWIVGSVIELFERPFRRRHAEKLSIWSATGCCMECGYDLRASTERCPECGAPIPRVDAQPPARIIIPETTPAVRKVVDRAAEIARSRDDDHIGTEHVLLAIIEDETSAGGAVLSQLQITPELAESTLAQLLRPAVPGEGRVKLQAEAGNLRESSTR